MKICIIGIGKRGQKHLEAALSTPSLELVGIFDTNIKLCDIIGKKYQLPAYDSLEEMLEKAKPEMAVLSLPHHAYLPVVKKLASHRVHILKEKPFAIDINEAKQLHALIQASGVKMMIACQRKFSSAYQFMNMAIKQIGKIAHIEGNYFLNAPSLEEGWRAQKSQSGGGALIDMGYHFIDLLLWYFGTPSTIQAKKTQGNRINQKYEVEDTIILTFDYRQKFLPPDEKTIGVFIISRNSPLNREKIIVKGNQGSIILTKKSNEAPRIRYFNHQNKLIEDRRFSDDNTSIILQKQLSYFSTVIQHHSPQFVNDYREHFSHISLIDAAYRYDQPSTITPSQCFNPHSDFIWPIVTDKTKQAVLHQMETSISIYDRSGIIKTFEDKFAAFHERQYALATNSGTNAIFAMFEGIKLMPGDEVIVPTYTFFATASPLMQFGAIPIFCDCLPDGNIDPAQIEQKITPKTKAVMVTHMWGLPCEMDKIVSLCAHYNLKLLEDCSHAHGAEYKGKRVGTFGDAAAWSLQGQKIITGGEGGILLTDNREIYEHAQLQGQYNKRCKQEISAASPYYKFALTGFGLKNRAHPFAIAMANQQFENLEEWLEQKSRFAQYIIQALAEIDFLIPPHFVNKKPAWYALVFQFDPNKAGISLEEFIKRLHQKGLLLIEKPESTGPIHRLPLFTHPHEAIPRLYSQPLLQQSAFPVAEKFYANAIKMPVWVEPEDKVKADKYIQGIKEVAMECKENSFVHRHAKL